MKIEVIKTCPWIHSQSNMSEGGLVNQVTICKLGAIIFFVRENVNGVDSFLISSGVRQGDKAGSTPAKHRQILELSAPEKYWEQIATLVREADPLGRAVKRNRRFTKQWVEKQMRQMI